MFTVTVEAPTRIDIAGGTLDIHPLCYVLQGPCTVNIGISLRTRVTATVSDDNYFHIRSIDQGQSLSCPWDELEGTMDLLLLTRLLLEIWQPHWPALTITTDSQSPAGAGLGGSSSLGVSFAKALCGMAEGLGLRSMLTDEDLVALVQNTETRLIHCPTGCQDYWGAVRGRLNILSFEPEGIGVDTLNSESLAQLDRQMLVCYSGRSRQSGINNWSIFKAVFDGDGPLLQKLNEIARLSRDLAVKARHHQWEEALALSAEEWQLRRSLWPSIETTETKRIDGAVRAAGAQFSRVCGAGGGGVMVVFFAEGLRDQVAAAIAEAGGEVLPAAISHEGLAMSLEREASS